MAMNKENQLLLIDELVGFENKAIKVQGFKRITKYIRKFYTHTHQSNKENPKDVNI